MKASTSILILFAMIGLSNASAADPPVPSSAAAFGPHLTLNEERASAAIAVTVSGDSARFASDTYTALDAVLRWNRIAIDASGLDHTPLRPGETRTFGEQLGPGRAARAMAIVHVALFEAINAVGGGYRSYVGLRRIGPGPSAPAAIAKAAHDTLAAMYPSQKATFDTALQLDLRRINNIRERLQGMIVGATAASLVLAKRRNDGSAEAEPAMGTEFVPSIDAGKWRQDPVSMVAIALGANWGHVKPFVMAAAGQFRAPPPPEMSSAAYAIAYDEVKRLGGDGATATERTADQTIAAMYWAYDGTPSLCAPPRLYNQITTTIARLRGSNGIQTARLLALVNVAMADAGIAIWESKYFYQFWRPVTGIREADEGMGPTGSGDGNAQTIADPGFLPLGAPASNLLGPNFTPPFPSYPSGHAGFGGALFQVLRRIYGTDNIAFTFVSDEFNGTTADNTGEIRPLRPRSFANLSQAEEENGQSRIYLGIHWAFDKTEGITQGQQVADYVVDRLFLPVR